ncbi:hypothetical protein NFI95_00235 [Acetobacteraceae bacterium KSS8]|uniref:Uncharacterized protein n=1 Tax=Endosaccharibacter trunci TaxID=2812733 RepID=A0ABT1W1Y3_9PROT|nr:hypothetical protein [Acetobacteraceae bacterium KSS8]
MPTQTGVDDVHAHPRHVGHRRLDLILALTAVFISAVSLYVAIEHGETERALVEANAQLVEANSWPFLQVEGSYSDKRETTIRVVNAGIGPAKLQSLEVLLDGKPVTDIAALLHACCGVSSDKAERHRQMPDGLAIYTLDHEVMRPGQSSVLINLPPPHADDGADATPPVGARFRAAANRISYRACYCSVFDTCWMSDLASLQPKPVAQCRTDIRSFNDDAE